MKTPLAGLVLGLFLAPPGWAVGLDASRVLVIYNSQNADSEAVWDHYSAMRPGVHGCDLDDPGLPPGTVSYSNFVAQVRNPIRAHLAAEDLAEQVVVLVLTKGLPHRIQDIGAGNIGDDPGGAYNRINAGNATYASVDSELTLLWQDLDGGEGGGAMDSPADTIRVKALA